MRLFPATTRNFTKADIVQSCMWELLKYNTNNTNTAHYREFMEGNYFIFRRAWETFLSRDVETTSKLKRHRKVKDTQENKNIKQHFRQHPVTWIGHSVTRLDIQHPVTKIKASVTLTNNISCREHLVTWKRPRLTRHIIFTQGTPCNMHTSLTYLTHNISNTL